jgi:hypothetical protein
MRPTIVRALLRTVHLMLTIPIVGYIYSPFEVLPSYAFPTRFIFLPTMVVTGLWMWKGQWVLGLFRRQRFSRSPGRI